MVKILRHARFSYRLVVHCVYQTFRVTYVNILLNERAIPDHGCVVLLFNIHHKSPQIKVQSMIQFDSHINEYTWAHNKNTLLKCNNWRHKYALFLLDRHAVFHALCLQSFHVRLISLILRDEPADSISRVLALLAYNKAESWRNGSRQVQWSNRNYAANSQTVFTDIDMTNFLSKFWWKCTLQRQ